MDSSAPPKKMGRKRKRSSINLKNSNSGNIYLKNALINRRLFRGSTRDAIPLKGKNKRKKGRRNKNKQETR